MGSRPRHQLPRAEILRRAGKSAGALCGKDERFDGADDVAGDLVLDGKDVAKLAVILLGPVMQPVLRLDQLGADTQSPAGAANASAQQITHAQFAADGTEIGRAILV